MTPLRAGNVLCCENCDATLRPKRGSRRQKFCSYKCRDEARRARNFAFFGSARRGSQGIPRSVENKPDNSTACNGRFRDQPPDISAPKRVIAQELFDSRDWIEVISPDGVACVVAQMGRRRQ
jgi:hypothetical protein